MRQHFALLRTLVNLRTSQCHSTRWVSEELGGSLSFIDGYATGAKVFATQLSCSGGFCDKLSFHTCQIQWPDSDKRRLAVLALSTGCWGVRPAFETSGFRRGRSSGIPHGCA